MLGNSCARWKKKKYLESGIDVTSVQSILDHVRSETTLEYSHAIRPKIIVIKSPLDS